VSKNSLGTQNSLIGKVVVKLSLYKEYLTRKYGVWRNYI